MTKMNSMRYRPIAIARPVNTLFVSQNRDGTWNTTEKPQFLRQKRKNAHKADMNAPNKRKYIAKNQDRRLVSTSLDQGLKYGQTCTWEASQYSNAPVISQNEDGTWNTTKQVFLPRNSMKRKRSDGDASRNVKSLSAKKQQTPFKRANKKKVDRGDEDFDPPEDVEEEDFFPSEKRKPAPGGNKQKPGEGSKYNAYHQSQQENLPAPIGEPPAWADKRQQLCETLPYYKAYMSGGYIHDGLVRALLIDREVRDRDVFDEEVVITTW